MSRAYRRGPWMVGEDSTLLSLVTMRGPNNWVQISQHMHCRSPKQCRERYHQNLKASLNHEPISVQEGELIEQMVTEMGRKWAEIARRLGNRSDNAVKNWWNGCQNRRKRNVSHHSLSTKTLTNRTEPLPLVSPTKTSSSQQHPRRANLESGRSEQRDQAWQSQASIHAGPGCDRDHVQILHATDSHERLQLHLADCHSRLDDASYRRGSEHLPSSLDLSKSTHDHVGQLLPSLGPINTRQPPQPYPSQAIQPPHSASSAEFAPSLVSDHNSTYSISPKTWPSPRPALPPLLDVTRAHWPESGRIDRRGSAPAISNLVSLPFTGDEGYVSAIPPSASSEQKHRLPTPVSRTAYTDTHGDTTHRHSASTPNISVSAPMIESSQKENPSNRRDSRMNFSSLLN